MYDNQLLNLKTVLPTAKKVLIALPTGASVDKLASGLALYLSLNSQGKEVTIVSEDNILVGQSHLFAIDKIQKTLVSGQGGNFVLTLEGVATQDANGGSVPSLEKLDYFVEGNNLNLVFRVIPGQTFNPSRIIPQQQGANGYDVIFTIGAQSLANLGGIYASNMQTFGGPHIVNIDNSQANTNFGQTNIVDMAASSVSEIVANMMPSLALSFEGDIATNLLTGIFDATANLTGANATANTYQAVASLMQAGGQKPMAGGFNVNPTGFPQAPVQSEPVMQPLTQTMPQMSGMPTIPGMENSIVNQQVTAQTQQPATPSFDFKAMASQTNYDLSAFIPGAQPTQPVNPAPQPVPNVQPTTQNESFPVPPVVNTQPQNAPSAEERPAGEGVITEAEPDWLTPKIFKGTSIG